MQLNAVNPNGATPAPDISTALRPRRCRKHRQDAAEIHRWVAGFYTDENNGGTVTQNSLNEPTMLTRPAAQPFQVHAAESRSLAGYLPTSVVSGEIEPGFVVGSDPSVTSDRSRRRLAHHLTWPTCWLVPGGTSEPVLSSVTNEVDAALTHLRRSSS